MNKLPSQLISSLKSNFKEYKLIGNEGEFHEKITKAYLEDILNYDIPYFTEKEGIIYYGLPERKIALFERQ